ncbi:MAG: hypothetical protein LUG57_01260, partial [Oscillospiraceae bacterium]|nr:hypothetical protein [Oscillospiraceae bacterium]
FFRVSTLWGLYQKQAALIPLVLARFFPFSPSDLAKKGQHRKKIKKISAGKFTKVFLLKGGFVIIGVEKPTHRRTK